MIFSMVRLLALLVALLLALTGFGGMLLAENGLNGYLLLAHVGLGGAFLVLLVLFAMGGAGRTDARLAFWAFLVFGLGAGLTVLVSMFPLFGSEGQILLHTLHWSFALGATVAGAALAVRC